MRRRRYPAAWLLVLLVLAGCSRVSAPARPIAPRVTTAPVPHDADDPAVWVNRGDPAQSLILGTDKDADGGLFVYDLAGRLLPQKTVHGLRRPNNVDVEYDLMLGGRPTDIAAVTERYTDRLRIVRLPDMIPIDRGGIELFAGEAERAPMGIALYRRPADGAVFAIVSRKSGPRDGYLWEYRLEDDGQGAVAGRKVRAFGRFSGTGEIEAVAVDDALGTVYYADELAGIHKYRADPDAPQADQELALFGTDEFTQQREGISIYAVTDRTGYILVSDQQGNQFQVYRREGEPGNPNWHLRIKTLTLSTRDSDGSEAVSLPLGPNFPAGLFVAMSEPRVFQLYSWADFAPLGLPAAPR